MRHSRRGHHATWMSFAVVPVRVTVLTPAAHGDMPPMPAIAENGFGDSHRSPGLADVLRSEFGFDLCVTCNGDDWWLATRDGFGRPYDFGVWTMATSRAGLFLRRTNLVDGATMLRSRVERCKAAPRTAAAGLRRRHGPCRGARSRQRWPLPSDQASGASGLSRRDVRRLEVRAYRR
jgi:hypothetical protein